MSRNNLTSESRSFKKNDRSFIKDSTGTPIQVTVDASVTATTVIIDPRTLNFSGPGGADVNGVTVDRTTSVT